MSQSDFGIMSELSNSHPVDQAKIESYLEKYKVLDNLVEKGQTIHFLFNYNTLSIEYLSQNAFGLTRKDRDYFAGTGDSLLRKIFRDKDVHFIVDEIPKAFQTVRDQYQHDEIENLSFQIFIRLSEDLCGGRNKMFQYQVVEFDESKKPLLCMGWVSDVSFASEPQYISIAVNHINDGESENVYHQRLYYGDEILSNREIQIVRLLVEGNTSQNVADELNISVKTVNNHRQNILRKLGAKSTSEVIRYAVMRGHF